MNYKMLVLDMDDTLLRDDHTISKKNKDAIQQALEKGIKVILASGRPTLAMTDYAKELKLDKYNSYIISYNGAQIVELKSEKVIFEQSLTPAEIHQLYDFSKKHKVDIITYTDGKIVSENYSEYIAIEEQITGIPFEKVTDFKATITKNCIKCLMLEEPTYLKQVESKLKTVETEKNVSMSKPFFLEIMPNGIDKAASLERLAIALGIEQKEIIAVGNASNDLSMVEYAGLGVWVDNVTPELRDKADVIVASNENDGVAEVIETYIL